MKKILLLFISVLTVITLYGTVEMQEESDAVYHQIVKEYTIYEDGSYDLRYFKELELKSHYAFNQLYGETFVVYNPDYQELEINEAYTIMADGKKTPSPDNAFNEVLPRQANSFPDYSHLKEMVITHTGLEVGATIYLDYKLKTSAEMYGGFSVKEMLRKRVPVHHMKIIVHTPEDFELDHQVNNLRTAPEIEETGNGKTYTWQFKGLEPLAQEGNMCESEKEWLTIQGPEGLSAHIDPDKLQSTLPAELAKKAGELAEKADDDAEIVNAIYSYLTANIDASPLHQKYIGNRVRSSEKVWQSNIATVTERAVLLSSMLKEAGISAMPALLVHKGAMPVLDDNSQMVVRVDLKNEAPLLLPLVKSSAENVLYQHAGKELIPLEKGKTDQRMKIQPKKNAYHFSAQLKLSDDTVTGTGEIMLMHAMNPHLEIRNDENQLKSKVDQLKVTDLSVDQSSSATTKADFEYGMQLKQLTKEHFGRLLMTLPDVQGGITGDDLTLWNERVTPFEIPFPVHGEVDFTFHLEGLKCLNESFEHTQSSKIGEVSVNLEVKPEKVMVRKSFSLHNQCYNPMEYSEIRGILRAFMSDEVNQLIFKRIE